MTDERHTLDVNIVFVIVAVILTLIVTLVVCELKGQQSEPVNSVKQLCKTSYYKGVLDTEELNECLTGGVNESVN